MLGFLPATPAAAGRLSASSTPICFAPGTRRPGARRRAAVRARADDVDFHDEDTASMYAQLRQRGAVVGEVPKPEAELAPADLVHAVLQALQRDGLTEGNPGCKVLLGFLHPTYRAMLKRVMTMQGYLDELNPQTCQLYLDANGVRSVVLNAASFQLLDDPSVGDPAAQCSTVAITAHVRKSDMEQAQVTFTLQKDSPSESWLIADLNFVAGTDYQFNDNNSKDEEKALVDELTDAPTHPDPSMRPIDVVNSIMVAMAKNDEPYPDHGSEIFLNFSGPDYIETLTRFVTQNGYWEVLTVEHVANLIRSNRKLWILHGFKDYGFRSEWTVQSEHLVVQEVYLVDCHDTIRKIVFTLARDMIRSACWLVKDLDVLEVTQVELDRMNEEDGRKRE